MLVQKLLRPTRVLRSFEKLFLCGNPASPMQVKLQKNIHIHMHNIIVWVLFVSNFITGRHLENTVGIMTVYYSGHLRNI